MFKVGDIVEITEESSATGMLDFINGKGYTVEAVDDTKNAVMLLNESWIARWYHTAHFKLKEEAKVEKKECLFKEGQVVWDVVYGKGVVDEIVDNLNYPVVVCFSDEIMAYTVDGRTFETHGRTLYFSEPKIEAATEPLFEPVLNKGDVVVAVDNNEQHSNLVLTVTGEDEHFVNTRELGVMGKQRWNFYRLGEKIEFN